MAYKFWTYILIYDMQILNLCFNLWHANYIRGHYIRRHWQITLQMTNYIDKLHWRITLEDIDIKTRNGIKKKMCVTIVSNNLDEQF